MQYDAAFPPKDFFCLNWKNLRGEVGGVVYFFNTKIQPSLRFCLSALKIFSTDKFNLCMFNSFKRSRK